MINNIVIINPSKNNLDKTNDLVPILAPNVTIQDFADVSLEPNLEFDEIT